MTPQAAGLVFALLFVFLESLQTVFFGGLFQRVNSFLFGAIVFGLASVGLIGWTALRDPRQIRAAMARPGALLLVNLGALTTFTAFLLSVQLIEPAITYTVSSAMMPVTALVLARLGWQANPGGQGLRTVAVAVLLVSVIVLCAGVLAGQSGFVRGGSGMAMAGLLLAMVDGIFFTLILVGSDRLNAGGTGPAAVLGLRLPAYVAVTAMLAGATLTPAGAPDPVALAGLVGLGLLLTVPPLYFLQRAVPLLSTFALSALTALGPLVIFGLQRIEGRVDYAAITLAGLLIYVTGSLLAAVAALRNPRPA